MTPLVSILIPAFNAEEWLADTLGSAIAQTWPRKEIIVVDDGSTDGTLAVARRFASREVSVITQANQGAAAARNRAFSLCQGDYTQWLDADDLLSPDKVARQLQAVGARSERTLLSCAWGSFMYRPHHAEFSPSDLWCDLAPKEWLIRKMGQNLHMQTATWLVSRQLTEIAGPWDVRLLGDDDGEYFCRVLLASEHVRFVPEGRVFYRVVGVGRLSYIGRSHRKMEAHFASMRQHINYLLSLEDSARTRTACLNYLQTWLLAFIPERPDTPGPGACHRPRWPARAAASLVEIRVDPKTLRLEFGETSPDYPAGAQVVDAQRVRPDASTARTSRGTMTPDNDLLTVRMASPDRRGQTSNEFVREHKYYVETGRSMR
jgi:glycosyltransferase involved in cell wall biosynthesis